MIFSDLEFLSVLTMYFYALCIYLLRTCRISNSSYWLIFLRSETFTYRLKDPLERSRMQPSLVLSALAMANLMRSSELERGRDHAPLAPVTHARLAP